MRMMRIMQIRDKATKIIYPELSYKLNGIFFKVHNELGFYGKEKQYSNAIELYLKKDNLKYEREKALPVSFSKGDIGKNVVDFLVEGKILIEVKAKRFVTREDYNQTQRYLRAFNLKLGILVNFHDRILKPKRVINSMAKE